MQATSHYLNQWWLVYRHIYASLGLNELRYLKISNPKLHVKFTHLKSQWHLPMDWCKDLLGFHIIHLKLTTESQTTCLFVCKILANERKCYVYNIFPQLLRLWNRLRPLILLLLECFVTPLCNNYWNGKAFMFGIRLVSFMLFIPFADINTVSTWNLKSSVSYTTDNEYCCE